jgi:hypothetical protein
MKRKQRHDLRSNLEKREDALAGMALYQDQMRHGRSMGPTEYWIAVAIVGALLVAVLGGCFFGALLLFFAR